MKYSKGKIYRIVIGDKYYIGSTTLELNSRLQSHRYMSKKHPNMKLYKYAVEYGWDKVTIELIEDYPCETYKELLWREKSHILLQDDKCLNSRIPIQGQDEIKEKQRIHNKKWDNENKEQRKVIQKRCRDKRRETETPEQIEARRKYQREYMRARRSI